MASTSGHDDPGAPDTPGQFVGRDGEFRRIADALRAVDGGRAQLLLISGEAGLGKSRLIQETIQSVRSRGWRAVTGTAYEAGREASFDLAIDLMRGIARQAISAEEREGAQQAIGVLSGDRSEVGLNRWQQVDAVTDALGAATNAVPPLRLAVFEDLHNADASTLELLVQVLRELEAVPLLSIATFRGPRQDANALLDFVESARRTLSCDRIELVPIPDDTASDLVRSVTAGSVDEATIEAIIRRGDGNPLFLEEAARDAVRAARAGGSIPRVPTAIRELVIRRIAALSDDTRHVAAGLAVVGEPGDLALIEEAVGVPPAVVVTAIDSLLAEGILSHDEDGQIQFKHALTRDALYEWVPDSHRRELHARAANAIETTQGSSRAAAVAHHLLSAGGADARRRAASLLAQAGESSLAQLAHEQAAEQLGEALDLMVVLGESTEATRRIRLRLAEARRLTRADDGVLALFEEVADEAAAAGDVEMEATAAIGYERAYLETGRPRTGADARSLPLLERARAHLESLATSNAAAPQVLTARVIASIAQALNFASDRAHAAVAAQQAVEIARASDDAAALSLALDTYRAAIAGPDTLEEVLRLTHEIVETSAASGEVDLELAGLFWQVWALLESGQRRDAEAAITRFGTLAERTRQPLRLSELHRMRGMMALLRGDLAAARSEAERAFQLAARAGNEEARIYYVAQMTEAVRDAERRALIREAATDFAPRRGSLAMRILTAYLLVRSGERDAAAQELSAVVDAGLSGLVRDHMWLALVGLYAQAAAAVGEPTWAKLGFDLLAPYSARFIVNSNAVCYGSAERILGQLASVVGDADAAEYERRANDLNRAFGADVWVAEASASTPVTKTFMFTDIVRSTNLAEAMGDQAWNGLLQWHNQTLEEIFRAFGGEEVASTGDGFFIAFADAGSALDCAIAIQKRLAEHRRTSGFAPEVRIGVHTAEASEVDRNYHGLGVHEAARISALAGAGEIFASEMTARGRALIGDPRLVELKGIAAPIAIVSVAWE